MSKVKLYFTRCCGVHEIDGLSSCQTPEIALNDLAYYFNEGKVPEAPFIIFTGVVKNSDLDTIGYARSERTDNYGETFARYIEENRLGTVVRSEPRVSWSKNTISIWVWSVDYFRLMPFLKTLVSYHG